MISISVRNFIHWFLDVVRHIMTGDQSNLLNVYKIKNLIRKVKNKSELMKFLSKVDINRIICILAVLLTSCNTSKDLWKEEDPIKQIVVNHATKQQKLHNLELVALSTPEYGKPGRYYIHYIKNSNVKIEEVRKLLVEVIESFIEYANKKNIAKDPISITDIIVNLGFVEEDGSFYEPPFIAYAYVKDGTIHYCYYDNLFGKFISHDDVKEPYNCSKNIMKSARKADET